MAQLTRGRKSRIRRLADSQELDTFILLAIMFNCVIMAFPPKIVNNATDPGDFFCLADFFLNVVFLFEFIIKFVAYGFAYFRDTWNQLDFVVVCQGTLSMTTECPYIFGRKGNKLAAMGDISALRMMRVLRPLKSLRKFPEMRLLVGSLFGSFHLLLAIMVLTAMAVFVFAVVATMYFRDAMDYRCLPDPYYDPLRGLFYGNPHANLAYPYNGACTMEQWQEMPATCFIVQRNLPWGNPLNVTHANYFDSDRNYERYSYLLNSGWMFTAARDRWLSGNYWKSISGFYQDYRRDLVPHYTEFPYFSSFCGDCDTCYKCPSCYSDDPDTECDRNIRDDFFRRYGDPRNIQATFLGEEPDIPADFFGNPLDYVFNGTDYEPSSWNYENKDGSVKHIAEYCVDLKLATIEQTDPDTGQIYQPKLRLGGIYLTRNGGLMDLTEPQHADISLRYDVANCGDDIRQANRVFEPYENNATICKQTFVDSGRFPSNFYEACVNYPDGITDHNCQNDYKGKIGELRHGFMGDIAPRHISAVWYLRFDKTFWSLLTIFDIMNMENWNDAMWSIQLCVGKYTWPFFYGVVGFVNICLINLFPAVMSFNLRKAIREEENRIAYEAKAQFMGDEMLTMTQFEEHMIDILAAEEEDIVAVKAYVEGHAGATLNLNAVEESDPLETLPGVPRGQFFDSLRSIVRPETGYFNTFIYTCIFLNLFCMAIEPLHSDERHMKKLQHALDVANEVFVGIFAFEICIKMTALGVTGYFYDAYNCFDFFLGVLSLMDVVAAGLIGGGSTFSLLRVVRMFRIARVLRMATVSKIHRKKTMSASQLDFARLMGIIASSAIWVVNVLGLLFLCVYMGSIVSMQFFGGEVYALNDYSEQWEKKGRLNFDTFTMAFVTNFVIISADGWNQIMYATMDACGAVTAIYFILLFVVGRYAILSMLIAVIFDQVERDSILVIKQSAQTTMVSIFKFERGLMHMILRFNFLRWYSASRSAFDSDATGSGGGKGNISLAPDPEPPLTPWQRFMSNERSYMIFNPEKQPRKFIKWLAYSEIFTNLVFATIMVSVYVLALFYQYRNTHLDARDKDKSNIATLVSLPENWLLALINTCCRVVFVAEFLVMTIAEGFLSFMSDPMNVLDTTITAISLISLVVPSLSPFAIFRMIRIIRPLKKLARSSPAVMSILSALENSSKGLTAVGLLGLFVWSTIAIVGLQLYSGHLHYCSASRYPEGMLLKPFSPDRDRHFGKSYRHWPYPQFQYYDSAYAYPDEPEGDDDAVWANFTHSYKGWPPERVIYPRSSPLANNSWGCSVQRDQVFPQYNRFGDVVSYAGWFGIKNAEYNFDNIFEAIRSAFLMFTFDDWHKLILQTINAKTVGPFYNHESQASTIMPVIFFILSGCSSFLITCLFVGVIYGTFTYLQLTRGTRKLASLKQAQWSVYESKLSCIKATQEPQEPRSNLLITRLMFRVFRHPNYKVVYACLIFLDIWAWWILAGSQIRLSTKVQQRKDLKDSSNSVQLRTMRSIDNVVSAILLGEFAAKFLVYGWFTTLSLPSEQMRLVLLIPVALYFSLEMSHGWTKMPFFDETMVQRGIYATRTSQVFLIVPQFVELRMVVQALNCALGTTVPMVALMTIVTFAFAVIGMVAFGDTDISKRYHADNGTEARVFGSYWDVTRVRFSTISKSMNTLFIAATSNNWVAVKDTMKQDVPESNHMMLGLFWFAYILLVRFLFLNVCTLIFIYKYESTSPVQPWIAMQQVDEFLQAWQHFDEFGVGRIRTKYLSRLLRLLSPPLGLSRDAPQQLADRHARRVLMAMPLLLEVEVLSRTPDLEARWDEVKKPFYSRGKLGSTTEGKDGDDAARQPSLLPRYLEFTHVLKAVHKVVMFPELQALPDDVELTLRREYAQAKLDILRLAVNRYCEPAVRAMDSHGNRVPQAVLDLALMQRARPDVFRYRLRQALTLEAHRWQKQIEFSKFDEESFFECGLLIKSIKEERLSAQMQLEVLHRLAAKGLLMSLQERRPKLHRHVTFLAALLNRVEAERSKHVRKAWLAGSMKHEGTLPAATKHAEGKDRAVSCVAVGGKDGELVVTAHGGRHVTVWKKRKDKKKKGNDDWRAAAREEERKEEARDPWHFAPFYKTQQMTEDLGTCLVVAMTPDGRRFFSSAGEQIRGWVQGKKVRGFKGTKFRCESIMLGHAATVTRLVVAHRHVFSVSEDGTIKIWRFRATDALQTATVSYSAQAMSLAILNTTKPGVPEDYLGLHAVAGLGDGSLCVLPFSLKSQWMQGAVWETKIKKLAFEGREPVTALDVQYRCVYAGCATGRIAVFKIVAGSEDMDTLQQAAKELERLGYGRSGDAFKRKGGGLDGRATSMLREVVRLDYVFTLDCHSSTITSFCMAGGVLFSAATDMAIVSWMKPVDERNTQFQALGAAGQGSHQPPAMTQKYSHARVVHRAPVTAMAVAGDFLLSADADGHVCCHKAAKYREIVESKQAEADSKNFLEEEILEKPRFFHQLEISKISARHFLAHVIAHYYPIRPLKKRKKKAPGEGDDDDDEFEDEIADDVEGDDEEYKEDREKSDDDEGSEHDDELAGDFDGDFDFGGGEDEDYDDLQGDFVGDHVAYEDEDEDYYDEDGAYFGDGFRSYPDDYDDVEDEDIMEDPYAGYDEPSDYATPYDDEAYEDEAYEDEDELSEDDVRLDVGEHFGEDEDEDEDDEEEEEDESGSEYED